MKRVFGVILCLLVAVSAFGQNSGALIPWVPMMFPNALGTGPAISGFVCSYAAGTTTPLLTYQNNTLVTANQNPIRLNAAGHPVSGSTEVSIYLQAASYKFSLFAAGTGNACNGTTVGALIRTADNIYDIAQLFALSFVTKNLDNIRLCDQWPGATAGAKIAACIADLPSTGGIADARGFEGSQTISTDFCSAVTKPVTILFNAATFTVSTNVTCGLSVTWGLGQGSQFSVSGGSTLTLTNPIIADQSIHFSGTGSVSLNQVTSPKWFGARGNGRTVTDAVMNSGSPTLSSATAAFVASDVGSSVFVCDALGAGSSLGPVTITGYTNATTVTLSSNASANITGKTAVFGYDDRDGIRRAIAATPTSGTVVLSKSTGFYYLALPKTANASENLNFPRDMTLQGEAGAMIKYGPEQPGGTSTYVALSTTNGTNVTWRDFYIEGPEHLGTTGANTRSFHPLQIVNSNGSLTMTNVKARKSTEGLKVETAISTGACAANCVGGNVVIKLDNVDFDTAMDTETLGFAETLIVFQGVYLYVNNSKLANHSGSYAAYLHESTSFRFVNTTLIPSSIASYAFGCHGPVGIFVPTFQQVADSTVDVTGVPGDGFETCGGGFNIETIDNVTFYNSGAVQRVGLVIFGSAQVSNSTFVNVGVLCNAAFSGTFKVNNSIFNNSYFNPGTNANANTIILTGNTFTNTNAAFISPIDLAGAATTFLLRGNTVIGGGVNSGGGASTYQMIVRTAASVDIVDHYAFNTGVDRAIALVTSNLVTALTTSNVWFQDTTKAYLGWGGTTAAGVALQPRDGLSSSDIASADLITLNHNYNRYRVTGTTAVSRISFQDANWTSNPSISTAAHITLLVVSGFRLTNGTYIHCLDNGTVRPAGSSIDLVYDTNTSKWFETGWTEFVNVAPTISSGFGTSPSIVAGTVPSFQVNVGTGGVATGGVIGMPTAATGWVCAVMNLTGQAANRADQRTVQTASTSATVTIQNQTISTGAALAWTASDKINLSCIAY